MIVRSTIRDKIKMSNPQWENNHSICVRIDSHIRTLLVAIVAYSDKDGRLSCRFFASSIRRSMLARIDRQQL